MVPLESSQIATGLTQESPGLRTGIRGANCIPTKGQEVSLKSRSWLHRSLQAGLEIPQQGTFSSPLVSTQPRLQPAHYALLPA